MQQNDVISIKCPNCGATLYEDPSRKELYCSYCGGRLLLQNQNEHIYRYIDEAKLKEVEANEKIQMRNLELLDQMRIDDEKAYKERRKYGLIMFITGVFIWFGSYAFTSSFENLKYLGLAGFFIATIGLTLTARDKTKTNRDLGTIDKSTSPTIRFPVDSVIRCKLGHYSALESILKEAGFTNIKCIAKRDLKSRFRKNDEYTIDSVSINGEYYMFAGEYIPKDSSIIITYHSY